MSHLCGMARLTAALATMGVHLIVNKTKRGQPYRRRAQRRIASSSTRSTRGEDSLALVNLEDKESSRPPWRGIRMLLSATDVIRNLYKRLTPFLHLRQPHYHPPAGLMMEHLPTLHVTYSNLQADGIVRVPIARYLTRQRGLETSRSMAMDRDIHRKARGKEWGLTSISAEMALTRVEQTSVVVMEDAHWLLPVALPARLREAPTRHQTGRCRAPRSLIKTSILVYIKVTRSFRVKMEQMAVQVMVMWRRQQGLGRGEVASRIAEQMEAPAAEVARRRRGVEWGVGLNIVDSRRLLLTPPRSMLYR